MLEPNATTAPGRPAAAVVKTLLVTDLVDSTRLVEQLGDERALEIAVLHDRLARDLLFEHRGREIDKTDGFLLLFERPIDAVRYAMDYHRGLARLGTDHGVALTARAGIHLGEVFLRDNAREDVARGAKPLEVEGLAKPMVARLMALALPGQTLLTQGAADLSKRALVGQTSTTTLRFVDHGPYLFKGVEEPVGVLEVGEVGAAPFTAPPSSSKAWRPEEAPAVRRSRLWRRTAAAAAGLIAVLAGLWWWSPGGRAGGARPVVAVLGFRNLSGDTGAAWIATALSEILASELAAGDRLRLISGESVARMRRELALPDGDTLAADTLRLIRGSQGIDYVVTGSYLAAGDRLAPLSVRLQATSSGETVASLQRFGTSEKLYDVVSETAKGLRSFLGAGGVTSDQAQAVRATLSANPEATRLYSEGLERLRNYDAAGARDLLEQATLSDPNYALAHAALSQAWSQLGYDQKASEQARRASELAGDLPSEETLIIRGRSEQVAGELEKAIDTYRLLWSAHPDNVEHGLRLAQAQTENNPTDALGTLATLRALPAPARDDPRLDAAEARAHWALSDYTAQIAALDRAIAKGKALGTSILVAESEMMRGWGLTRLGRYAEAETALNESRRLFLAAGDRGQAARTLVSLAILRQNQGELGEAEDLYGQALAVQRQIGNRQGIIILLNNISSVYREQGRISDGLNLLREALDVAREAGRRSDEGLTLEDESSLLLDGGQLTEASEAARRALAIYAELGELSGSAWTFLDLGEIEMAAGRLESARGYFEKALELTRQTRYPHLEGTLQVSLGHLNLLAGNLAGARAGLTSAAKIATDLGEKGSLAMADLWLAELALAEGKAAEAERLARSAAAELLREAKLPLHLLAQRALAESLLVQGQSAAARELLAAAGRDAASLETPYPGLRLAVLQARTAAAAGTPASRLEAARLLDATAEKAARLGLVEVDLEARLELARLSAAAGQPAEARGRFEAVLNAARSRGFGSLARGAEQGLSALKP